MSAIWQIKNFAMERSSETLLSRPDRLDQFGATGNLQRDATELCKLFELRDRKGLAALLKQSMHQPFSWRYIFGAYFRDRSARQDECQFYRFIRGCFLSAELHHYCVERSEAGCVRTRRRVWAN